MDQAWDMGIFSTGFVPKEDVSCLNGGGQPGDVLSFLSKLLKKYAPVPPGRCRINFLRPVFAREGAGRNGARPGCGEVE